MKLLYSRRNIKSIYKLISLLIISVIGYLLQPYSIPKNLEILNLNVIIFFISIVIYYRQRNNKNYMDFDTIFLCVFFIVGYLPGYFYFDSVYPYLFLHFPFNEIYITHGYWLFTIGAISYLLGRLYQIKIKRIHSNIRKPIKTNFLVLFFIFILILFIFFGGLARYQQLYQNNELNGGGITIQLEILLSCVGLVIIVSELFNKKYLNQKINNKSIISVAVTCILLLFVGNRTIPSYLILSFICLYATLFKPFNLKTVTCCIMMGIITMWTVQVHRSGSAFALSAPIRLTTDLTINTRNTYVAYEYVEEHSYTLGKSMLNGVISVIPFGSYIFNIKPGDYGSAEIMTTYTFSRLQEKRERIGLGTNIIADLYLAFGLIGVIFFMFFLGLIYSTISRNIFNPNYYFLIVFGCLSAYSVFLIRTGYTLPLRIIMWSLAIAYFIKRVK